MPILQKLNVLLGVTLTQFVETKRCMEVLAKVDFLQQLESLDHIEAKLVVIHIVYLL